MYPVARAAVPLLRFARRQCLQHPGDKLNGPLVGFFTQHVREERGHDRWVIADLTALGQDPSRATGALPTPAITDLLGAQYQLIADVHPVALLGCLAVLEGNPPADQLLEHIRAATGRQDVTAALSGHSASDAAHGQAVFALLDRLTLEPRLRALVGFSALHTASKAIALFAELASVEPAAGSPADEIAVHRAEAIADARARFPGLSDGEAAVLADIEQFQAGRADVVAHSGDVAGGLFL